MQTSVRECNMSCEAVMDGKMCPYLRTFPYTACANDSNNNN